MLVVLSLNKKNCIIPVCLFADEKITPRIKTTQVYGIASPNIERICMTMIPSPSPKNINRITTVGSSSFLSSSADASINKHEAISIRIDANLAVIFMKIYRTVK